MRQAAMADGWLAASAACLWVVTGMKAKKKPPVWAGGFSLSEPLS